MVDDKYMKRIGEKSIAELYFDIRTAQYVDRENPIERPQSESRIDPNRSTKKLPVGRPKKLDIMPGGSVPGDAPVIPYSDVPGQYIETPDFMPELQLEDAGERPGMMPEPQFGSQTDEGELALEMPPSNITPSKPALPMFGAEEVGSPKKDYGVDPAKIDPKADPLVLDPVGTPPPLREIKLPGAETEKSRKPERIEIMQDKDLWNKYKMLTPEDKNVIDKMMNGDRRTWKSITGAPPPSSQVTLDMVMDAFENRQTVPSAKRRLF